MNTDSVSLPPSGVCRPRAQYKATAAFLQESDLDDAHVTFALSTMLDKQLSRCRGPGISSPVDLLGLPKHGFTIETNLAMNMMTCDAGRASAEGRCPKTLQICLLSYKASGGVSKATEKAPRGLLVANICASALFNVVKRKNDVLHVNKVLCKNCEILGATEASSGLENEVMLSGGRGFGFEIVASSKDTGHKDDVAMLCPSPVHIVTQLHISEQQVNARATHVCFGINA
jgi:hypothetical protein